ncbi:MAG: hypothetical protein SF069_01035 [Phycisphaerae bacterium]|nr:hypothetical protein [Phycisphaerae bacterium]
MAIRFRCGQCSQPIEVDDPLAGKLARCPYCTAVVNVPTTSTLAEEPIATARPLPPLPAGGSSSPGNSSPGYSPPPLPSGDPRGGQAPYPLPPVHPSPEQAALAARGVRSGNYALICAMLVLGLIGVVAVMAAVQIAPRFQAQLENIKKESGNRPDFQETMRIYEKFVEDDPVANSFQRQPAVIALGFGSIFFAICGVSFAAASFRALGGANWRAWAAMVICAPYAVCNCCLVPVAGLGG